MKRGFTLIELLAVIVILAIIALIATPLVLNIIDESKSSAKLRGAENYITAVEQAIVTKNLEMEYKPNHCETTTNANLLTCYSSEDDTTKLDDLNVAVDGELPLLVKLYFTEQGKVKKDSTLKLVYTDKTITGSSNKLIITDTVSTANPVSFETDSWETIVAAFQDGSYEGVYNLGDEKEVDMGDLGKPTVRIANLSTPIECSDEDFSQTACGVVIEFVDVITTHYMNSTDTNLGGYPASSMRTYLNNDILNTIQDTTLKNAIIQTKVVSGHGSSDSNQNRTDGNWESTDYLYLLSPMEVYGTANAYDSSHTKTRQLDYYSDKYVTTSPSSSAIKELNGEKRSWWLRSANSRVSGPFFEVSYSGSLLGTNAYNTIGVSPAFRLNIGK